MATEYKIDLKKVTCECAHFKFRLKKFSLLDPQRLCKHLLPFADQINQGVKISKSRKSRHPREAMEALKKKIAEIAEYFAIENIEYCGSFRRRAETSGDMDILLSWKDYEDNWKDIENFFGWVRSLSTETLVDGKKKMSVVIDGIQTDVRIVPSVSWAYALMHSTGSVHENVRLRIIAKKKGMMLNEYGLYKGKSLIPCNTESEIYKALGESYKEPWER